MTKHFDKPFLEHILDAIRDINESINTISQEEFLKNKDIREANLRRLEVIGEAVKNISKEFRDKHKEIEWSKIAGVRDKIIHKYFEIDFDIVWEIIRNDIPKLRRDIEKIVNSMPKEE